MRLNFNQMSSLSFFRKLRSRELMERCIHEGRAGWHREIGS